MRLNDLCSFCNLFSDSKNLDLLFFYIFDGYLFFPNNVNFRVNEHSKLKRYS